MAIYPDFGWIDVGQRIVPVRVTKGDYRREPRSKIRRELIGGIMNQLCSLTEVLIDQIGSSARSMNDWVAYLYPASTTLASGQLFRAPVAVAAMLLLPVESPPSR